MIIENRFENAIAPFLPLWLTEDKQWLKQRKSDWDILINAGFSDCSKSELAKYKTFFLKAENKEKKYISYSFILLFIPYQTVEQVIALFNSDIFGIHGREELFDGYIFVANEWGSDLPWLQTHINLFIEAIYGITYKKVEEKSGNRPEIISPEPTAWCGSFINEAFRFFKGRINNYPFIKAIDYFVDALAHANKDGYREDCRVSEFIQKINEILDDPNSLVKFKELASQFKVREEDILKNWQISGQLPYIK